MLGNDESIKTDREVSVPEAAQYSTKNMGSITREPPGQINT